MLGVGEHSSPPFYFAHISLRMSDFRAAMVGGCQMFTPFFVYRTGRLNVQLSQATIHLSLAVNHNQGYASVEL